MANQAQNKKIYRVTYISSSYGTENYSGGVTKAIGHYVRASAIYQGLERHLENADIEQLPDGATIEYSVIGFANGDLTTGTQFLKARRTVQKEKEKEETGGNNKANTKNKPNKRNGLDVLKVGTLQDYTPKNDDAVQTPEQIFAKRFEFLDKSGQAPDLLIIDSVPTLYILRKLLWQRTGSCVTAETVAMQIKGIDFRQFSPLRNTKIWLVVRFEPIGFLPMQGKSWHKVVDRLYFIENFTPGFPAHGFGLTKEKRNPENLKHAGEQIDRKVIAPVSLQPEQETGSKNQNLKPHEARRAKRKKLFEALKKPLPEGTDPEGKAPVLLVASSRVTGVTEAKQLGNMLEKHELLNRHARQLNQEPITLWATPAVLPGGLEQHIDGVDGAVLSAGYNTFHGLRNEKYRTGICQNLKPGNGGNLHFVPVDNSLIEQEFRARHAETTWNDKKEKYLDMGNGADYLAEQIFKQVGRKFGQGQGA